VALGHVIVIMLGIVDLLGFGEASKSKNRTHQIRKDMLYRLGCASPMREISFLLNLCPGQDKLRGRTKQMQHGSLVLKRK